MGLPYMPINWGGFGGQLIGIYGSPMCRVWEIVRSMEFEDIYTDPEKGYSGGCEQKT